MIKKLLLVLLFFTASAFAQSHNIILTWTASTTSGVGYNIYRGTAAGQESNISQTASPTGVNCSGATCTYTDTANLVAGTTYYYFVRTINMISNAQSTPSNEASGMIPIVITLPNPPTNLKITIS